MATASSNLNFLRSRDNFGGNSAVINGSRLGQLNFGGYDGTDYESFGAAIYAEVDGTPGSNDMPGRLVFSTTADGASSPTERMRINKAGAVLIGTTSTASIQNGCILGRQDGAARGYHQFFATGTTNHILVYYYNDNGPVGTISTNGSSTSYNTSSDYRLKENVVNLDGAIPRLKTLPVHRFNFIAESETTVDGFLAHEAQLVVPEAVTGTKDEVDKKGNAVMQGIDNSKLVPLLTAALQEAITEIEDLKKRVKNLEG